MQRFLSGIGRWDCKSNQRLTDVLSSQIFVRFLRSIPFDKDSFANCSNITVTEPIRVKRVAIIKPSPRLQNQSVSIVDFPCAFSWRLEQIE